MPTDHGFRCESTVSEGLEQEILRLRNDNREHPETSQYIRWRYRRLPGAPEPRVFWLLSPDDERIGMASTVFRPYWINGVRVYVAVLGDISLAAAWRGRGLGLRLLRFATAYLDEWHPGSPGLVIPTEAARRSLGNCGWVTVGAMIPHVLLLDVSTRLRAVVRSEWIARTAAQGLRATYRLLTARRLAHAAVLRITDDLQPEVGEFLGNLRFAKEAVHDFGAQSLRWRYLEHPHGRFRFASLATGGKVRALLVYEESSLPGTCGIYDLVGERPDDLRSLLALFVRRCLAAPDLTTLRVQLGDRHPYRSCLRALGFVSRPAEIVFQVHSRDGRAERAAWSISQGDKDT